MRRSVFPCFQTRSQCLLLTEDASRFCSCLAKDLGMLEQSLARDSVSLKWSVRAMSLLKKVQVELLVLCKKSKLPISHGAEEDWFDRYMKETATLLDFCNSLKSAVSGINRYRVVVELAIQKLDEDNSSGMVDLDNIELERVHGAHEKFLDGVIKETSGPGSRISSGGNQIEVKSMAVVMLAANTTMIVLSLLLVSAMVSPVSIDVGNGVVGHEVPQLKPCMELLTQLVGRFHERTPRPKNGSGLALVEHLMVAEVVEDLKAQVVEGRVDDRERLLSGVELLRTRSAGLREGVERIDAAVDELFEEVMRGRNEMLGIYRDGALSWG